MFERSAQLTEWFGAYARDHRHPWTHRTHGLCIPLIVLSLMGFLNLIPGQRLVWGVPLGWTELVLATVLAFYAHHDLRLALAAAPAGALLAVASRAIPLWGHGLIFLAAWVLQLAGHVVWEKNRPSFTQNLVQLLVGPAFFLAGMLGIRNGAR